MYALLRHGAMPKQDLDAIKEEAMQRVHETFEKAKHTGSPQQQEEEPAYYQPLKTHAM
jgi:hypothetical protein